MSKLGFISDADFKKHVQHTIQHYGNKLAPYNLAKFNSNIVDPIKLIFDKTVYRYSWENIVENEIFRQRDKSTNNDIGYFHEGIFQYIAGCIVPEKGWDIIFTRDNGITLPNKDKVKTVFVEMKNKHNTMNSSSSAKTYMRMQAQLLSDDDCACFLVEAIARQSQNIAWTVCIDKVRQKHRRIRRVSMDEFYSMVTGQADAFYKMCMALPSVIKELVECSGEVVVPNDTVIDELCAVAEKEKNIDKDSAFALALYMLGFGSYNGFKKKELEHGNDEIPAKQ